MERQQQRTLRELATEAGFSISSLATLTRVSKSTIQKHWASRSWTTRMDGKTVSKMVSYLPGANEQVLQRALGERRREIETRCGEAGLILGTEWPQSAADGLPGPGTVAPQHLLSAVEAAAALVKGDRLRSQKCLRALWGREQSRALDYVFGQSGGAPAFQNPDVLLDSAESMFKTLRRMSGHSGDRVISQGILAHHVGKAGRPVDVEEQPSRADKAFFTRAAHMGKLRVTDDFDVAKRYGELVERDSEVRLIETWAFPTWTGDMVASETFDVPRSLRLVRTAEEVIAEVEDYNDAYVYYLVETYIPLALEDQDDSFGGKSDELRVRLEKRAEQTDSTELRGACERLAQRLP